jgi:hypothetical protein
MASLADREDLFDPSLPRAQDWTSQDRNLRACNRLVRLERKHKQQLTVCKGMFAYQ